MRVEKYKICNSCGAKNSIDEAFCLECMSTDLRIYEQETNNELSPKKMTENSDTSQVSTPDENHYKICNACGAKNDISEPFCVECFGTDFSEIMQGDLINGTSIVVEDKTVIDSSHQTLKLLCNGGERLINHNDIIGRQAVCSEILQDNKTVSRQHARFSFNDGEWYIEDLNSTNGTYVEDERVMPGKNVKILNGSEVKFSSSFIVKVLIGD